jgi:hypothetical protein
MEVRDKMIGNLVERDGNVLEVVRIANNAIHCETLIISKGLKTNSGRIIPMPITLELLDKLGFTIENKPNEDIEYYYKKSRFNIVYKTHFNIYYFCIDNIVLKKVKYIHEVQNLFYLLENVELKLKMNETLEE